MSLTQKKANELLIKISSETGTDLDVLYKIAGDLIKKPTPFASSKASDLAKEREIDFSKIKGSKNGRITIDDIRTYLGEEVSNKKPSLFASKGARLLAEENDLTEKDFTPKLRTGRKRKDGRSTITIENVNAKIGKVKTTSPYASPQARKDANNAGLSPSSIKGTGKKGKITKSDVKKHLNSSSEASSSSDSSDSE